MAYVIGYHGKDNQWSYWTTKHGFARKDLKNVSMFVNNSGLKSEACNSASQKSWTES